MPLAEVKKLAGKLSVVDRRKLIAFLYNKNQEDVDPELFKKLSASEDQTRQWVDLDEAIKVFKESDKLKKKKKR